MFIQKRESEIPRCPFCLKPFGRIEETALRKSDNFYKWVCGCGAYAVYDATGNILGEAFMEGLVFACQDDWDKALALDGDNDYQVKYLEGYSRTEHRLRGVQRTYKTGLGAFIFIKLAKNS
jgi:hypothetical protein